MIKTQERNQIEFSFINIPHKVFKISVNVINNFNFIINFNGFKQKKDLSTDEKIKIIQQYDALANKNQRIASKELGISQPSLCKILKHRQDIMN